MTWSWTWRRWKQGLRRQPSWLLGSFIAFALLVFLAGGARLAQQVSEALVPRLAEDLHVIAYLRDDMSEEQAAALSEIVLRVPGVETVRQIDSQQALQRLRQEAAALGGVAHLLEGVEEGFLPRSIEVRLRPTAALAGRSTALADRLRRIPGVAEVDAMEDGTARLRAVLTVLQRLGWALFALSWAAGAAALSFPLLHGREHRRQEVAVLTMLGETPAGIRRPWALTGALAALLGSACAWVALWWVHGRIVATLEGFSELVPSEGGVASLAFLPGLEIVIFTLLAIGLGLGLGRLAMPRLREAHA